MLKLAVENKASNVLSEGSISKDLNYDNSRIAGDIEPIRSRIIIDRAAEKLPLSISYFSKGAVLEYELYKQTPFNVEVHVKDSSAYGYRFLIDFPDKQHLKLTHPEQNGEKITEEFPVNRWFATPVADFRVSISNFSSH